MHYTQLGTSEENDETYDGFGVAEPSSSSHGSTTQDKPTLWSGSSRSRAQHVVENPIYTEEFRQQQPRLSDTSRPVEVCVLQGFAHFNLANMGSIIPCCILDS